MVSTLEKLGIHVEMSHHEVAPSQHELDFEYSDALTVGDNVMIIKQAIKTVAFSLGLYATFMPKPVYGINVSGMYTHQSLFGKNGRNIFYDPKDKYELSRLRL